MTIQEIEDKAKGGQLAFLKMIAEARGYRFETDADGTERMIRPDGTVSITARRNKNRVELVSE